jgi:hypothetical protein
MSVMIEGVSVVISFEAVLLKYKGGLGQFLFEIPNVKNYCVDGKLARVKFETHDEAKFYMSQLATAGLKIAPFTIDEPYWSDAVLVDQAFGPNHMVYWFNFGRKLIKDDTFITFVWHSDEDDEDHSRRRALWAKDNLIFPKDWKLEKSDTRNLDFLRMSEIRSVFDH